MGVMPTVNVALMRIAVGVRIFYMIAKPTYAIHLWVNSTDVPIFSIIENEGIPTLRHRYRYHEMINGRLAVVFVFYDYWEITRSHCISAATRFMKGDYIRIDVDLHNLKSVETKGVDLTHPPH